MKIGDRVRKLNDPLPEVIAASSFPLPMKGAIGKIVGTFAAQDNIFWVEFDDFGWRAAVPESGLEVIDA